MRWTLLALFVILFHAPVRAADGDWAELMQDDKIAGEIDDAIDDLEDYFKAEKELREKPNMSSRSRQSRQEKASEALTEFRAFLARSEAELGVDLSARPGVVLEILDRARIKELETPRRGIDYVAGEASVSRGNFEFAVQGPDRYQRDEERYPLVVSLHGRVINPKHPAFRGSADFSQRSRQVIYNNWRDTPGGAMAVVLAPTGKPNGFLYEAAETEVERQKMFRSVGAGLRDYRTDWNRVFLEVHGPALRLVCEQMPVFAGAIVREREDDRSQPIVPEDQRWLLENLNGLPLIYIADKANWEKVGKPMVDHLTELYAETFGQPGNLVVMQSERGPNGELPGDPEKIAEFLETHRRPVQRPAFQWRFAGPDQTAPEPVYISRPNFSYAKDQPLAVTAGSMKFRYSLGSENDAEGNPVAFNKIEIDVTEAEALRLHLSEQLMDLDLPVTLIVNGETLIDKERVERDWSFFFNQLLDLRFYMFPYVGELRAEFPLKPQYTPPAPPEEEATDGAAGEESSGEPADAAAGEPQDR